MVTEQRVHQRFRTFRPVRILPARRHHPFEILTKDLSLGGARCISPALIEDGTEVHVELLLHAGEPPVRADGRVSWFRTIPESEQFELGICFQEMSSQDRSRLSHCLGRLSHRLLAESISASSHF